MEFIMNIIATVFSHEYIGFTATLFLYLLSMVSLLGVSDDVQEGNPKKRRRIFARRSNRYTNSLQDLSHKARDYSWGG